MLKITDQKGQSILEMLVAIFVLVVVLTATIVLIITSINASRHSKNKLIATSLAREGIEIVRNIRDSNWIDPSSPLPSWDDGLFDESVNNYSTALPIIDGSNPVSLKFADYDFTAAYPDIRIKVESNSYLQGEGIGADSSFYRLLYINPICHDDSETEQIIDKELNNDCSDLGGTYSKVGIRVISEVRWSSPDAGQKVIIEDRLYNWQVL